MFTRFDPYRSIMVISLMHAWTLRWSLRARLQPDRDLELRDLTWMARRCATKRVLPGSIEIDAMDTSP